MKKITAVFVMIFFSALSSQATDFNRCFTHSGGAKGIITINKTVITLHWFAEFDQNGEPVTSLRSQSTMVGLESEKNIGASKIVIGDAFLIGIRDELRSDDAQPRPTVTVTIDESSVSFVIPTVEGVAYKYPIVPCHQIKK